MNTNTNEKEKFLQSFDNWADAVACRDELATILKSEGWAPRFAVHIIRNKAVWAYEVRVVDRGW